MAYGNRRRHFAFAPNGGVGRVCQVVLDMVRMLKLGDQIADEQTIDDGGFGTAAQIGRQWFNIAIRAVGGGFDDGGLGGGQFDVHGGAPCGD